MCISPDTFEDGVWSGGRSNGEIHKKCLTFSGKDLQSEAGVVQHSFVSQGGSEN